MDILRPIVAQLRAAWPGVRILVRADNGLGVPAVYDFCEAEGLDYAIGYASNAVLERATAQALDDLELYYALYGRRRGEHLQRFEEVRDYQAGSWPHPRRIMAKVEVTPSGSQRRFVVTNLPARPEAVYRELYVQRGAVPEQPIGEMKNGLRAIGCRRAASVPTRCGCWCMPWRTPSWCCSGRRRRRSRRWRWRRWGRCGSGCGRWARWW